MFSTNSGEAVPGMAGLSGTIQVSCLILLVGALTIAVIAAGVRRQTSQSQKVADALLTTVHAALGAAVIAGSGALFLGGSTLYQVSKVEAERAPAEGSSGECSASEQTGSLGDNANEIAALTDWEAPEGATFENVRYWPDPESGCDEGTVDSCRMIQVTGTKPGDGAMGNLTDVGFNEWVEPKGECADGGPEQVEFD
ncbi:hypothetical protein EDL96_12790 [Kocuria soli]|uniref:Uncharacterized protein n=1 Tax=Kocuria soli TaxID=2485125 RepID=A0A3N3ZLZ1_9MICC|nr:hypothetical protein [Kocuria soli]ROZ61627.1 hypothetical protein EDL96_12790 [Kocuria soli]